MAISFWVATLSGLDEYLPLMHRAGVEKKCQREQEYDGGKSEGKGVSHNLHSIGQDVILKRCDYHRD